MELLNNYLKYNRHLIEINFKDAKNLYNNSIKELIQYFKKLTPYDDESIKEILNLNIKQIEYDLKRIGLK